MRTLFSVAVNLLLLWLLLPLLAILFASITVDSVPVFPPSGFGLKWYRALLDVESFRSGLRVSLAVACIATLLATPLGVAAAIGLTRWSSPWRVTVETALLAPVFVPGLVSGIGLLVSLSWTEIEIGLGRLIAGHLLIIFPYIVRTTYASLAGQDPALEEAARTLGAGEARILWSVVLPLARPGMTAGMLFAFIVSFDDVPVSLFLADARSTTLPLAVLSYIEFNFDPTISAVAAAQVIVTFVAAIGLEQLFGLRKLYGAGGG
jgi:putative spermidine/putrescine transport system permease protein